MQNKKLIEPSQTKAILIGVSEFQDKQNFVNAPPIKNNILKLEKLLQDTAILGLPKENIIVFNQNERHDDILDGIETFLKEDFADTVIFYFAGHGYKTKVGDFYMVTHNSRASRMRSTSIHWNDIKAMLQKGAGIEQRFYILDACHSGAATLDADEKMLDIEKGSALLAAASEEEKAYFNKKEKYTDFTSAFIQTLEKGAENTEVEAFDVDFIHENINSILANTDNRFDTQIKKTDKIDNVFFFKNKRYDDEIKVRMKISGLLKRADSFIEKEDYDTAEILLEKAQTDTKNLRNKKQLLTQIEKLLTDCKYLPRYKVYFERKFDEKLKIAVHALKTLEQKIPGLQKELDQKKIEIEKAITTSIQDQINLNKFEKEKITLEKRLKDSELKQGNVKNKINDLEKQITILRNENRTLKEEVKKLKNTDSFTNIFIQKINDISFEMTSIEGGSFKMGDGSLESRTKPVHEVTVADFFISQYPVTQKLWREVMGKDPGKLQFKGCDKCPVQSVTWKDTQEFLVRLNEKTDIKYRLPSEAEWEYAARGGRNSKGFLYAGSNNLNEVAWFKGNAEPKTYPVGQKKANELDIYDMNGNVWEWCEDDWHNNYRNAPRDGSAWVGAKRGSGRVGRGGSWSDDADRCRVAYRSKLSVDYLFDHMG